MRSGASAAEDEKDPSQRTRRTKESAFLSAPLPSVAGMNSDPVVIDCDTCLVRSPSACGDCVVSVLLGAPPQGVEVDAEEMAALTALADEGLVPPLRLVTPVSGPDVQAG